MKTIPTTLMILGLAVAPLKLHAQATPKPPGQISYQGFLTDANGLPLATNAPVNYNVIFRIFNASTSGSLLWAEQQVVTVDRGYFTVMLGNGSAVSGAPNSADLTPVFSGSDASDRFLEITVQGLAPGDPPIAPRLRLLASPYSFLASKALTVDAAGTVPDTSLSANVALRAGGNTFSLDQHFTQGDLYLDNKHAIWAANNSGTPDLFFWPRYSDNVTYMNYGSGGFNIRNNGSSSTMFMDNSGNVAINGNVGIGTSPTGVPLSFAQSPGDKLSLYSSVGGNYYGFGIASFQLQIHTDTSQADVVFGYGAQSTTFGETMRIKGTGQVGIGTTSPGKMLQIGDGGVNGSEGMIRLASRSSTGSGAARTWDIGVPQTGDNANGVGYSFVINDGGTTDFMVQYNSGNVGIGTTAPAAKLDVNGTIHSPMWHAANVLNAGGIDGNYGSYNTSASFSSNGGTLIISVSGSGRGPGGTQIGMGIKIDGTLIDTCQILSNDTGHHAFVPRTIVQTGIGAGNHTLAVYALGNTAIDSNDKVYASIQELPY